MGNTFSSGASDLMLEKIFQFTADGILVLDDNGVVLCANPAAGRLLDRSADDLVGHHFGWPITGEGPGSLQLIRSEGEPLLVELRASEVEWDGQPAAIVALRDVTEREAARHRSAHLHAVLHAINEINKLIVRESDPDTLLQKACDVFVKAPLHEHAWLALFDGDGRLGLAKQSGIQQGFSAFRERLRSDDHPHCVRKALETSGVVRIDYPVDECVGCPLVEIEEGVSVLKYGFRGAGGSRGVLSVRMKSGHESDREEQELLAGAAEDLGFALRQMENRIRRDRAERALRERVKELRCLSRIDGVLRGNRAQFSQALQQSVECIPPGWQFPSITEAKITYDGTDYVTEGFAGRGQVMTEPIVFGETKVGEVTVSYEEPQPDEDEGPFLEEERSLLASVAHRISDFAQEVEYQRSLEESEERQRRIIRDSPFPMMLHAEDGEVLLVNEVWTELTGYAPEDIGTIGDWTEKAYGDRKGVVQERIDRLYSSSRRVEEGKFPVRTKDGDERIWEFSSAPMGEMPDGRRLVLSTAADVTAGERAEAGRRIRDRAIEASLNGISITDLDGKVMSANPAALDMWGYESAAQVAGRKAGEFWENPEKVQEAFEEAKAEGAWSGELTSQRRDGSTFPAHASLSVVRDESGVPTHVVGIFLDITDQKRTNRRLQETVEKLRKTELQVIDQERQRALTHMASGIAHDFNNALSTIRGFTELLLEHPEKNSDSKTVTKYLSMIDSAASKAAETVRRMRKFYRPREEAEMAPVDLNSVVDEAISLTRPRWQQEAQAEGVSVDVRRDLGELSNIRGNASELHEMLSNFIFNAVDAMEDDGQIEISTRDRGDEVVLEVTDTGSGMDEDTRRHCLDPFFTTKGAEGSGLGLSTTVGIVNRHEGEIEVESEPDAGTTFRVTIPANSEISSQTPRNRDEKPTTHQSFQVLVAEDDRAQRRLMGEMLESMGHLVTLASDGEEALHMFDDGWYHLIITDRAMPGIRGDELARLIRERVPDKPIVMLTGFGDMMEAASEKPDHVDLVISKPVSLRKMRTAIRETVGEGEE